jgi:hypothetical protein
MVWLVGELAAFVGSSLLCSSKVLRARGECWLSSLSMMRCSVCATWLARVWCVLRDVYQVTSRVCPVSRSTQRGKDEAGGNVAGSRLESNGRGSRSENRSGSACEREGLWVKQEARECRTGGRERACVRAVSVSRWAPDCGSW